MLFRRNDVLLVLLRRLREAKVQGELASRQSW